MTCKSCDNEKIVARGWCSKHYDQWRYNKIKEEICVVENCNTKRNSSTGYCSYHYTSLRVLDDPLARGMASDYCQRGGHLNPEYYTYKDGTRACKECRKQRDRERNKTDKRKRQNRNRNLLRQYGITIEEYEALIQKQDGLCVICNQELIPFTKHGASVDHCHKTGKVRGVLHGRCNSLLGFIEEDIESLKRAIEYLSQ